MPSVMRLQGFSEANIKRFMLNKTRKMPQQEVAQSKRPRHKEGFYKNGSKSTARVSATPGSGPGSRSGSRPGSRSGSRPGSRSAGSTKTLKRRISLEKIIAILRNPEDNTHSENLEKALNAVPIPKITTEQRDALAAAIKQRKQMRHQKHIATAAEKKKYRDSMAKLTALMGGVELGAIFEENENANNENNDF